MADSAEIQKLAAGIANKLESIFDSLQVFATEVARRSASDGDGVLLTPTPTESEWIRLRSCEIIEAHELAHGAGVIFNPERVESPEQFIHWQVRDGKGVSDFSFSFEDDATDYYDFMQLPWYAAPKQTHKPSLFGPYLDFGGVDEYIITLTIPVLDKYGFVGVTGVDIAVDTCQEEFLREGRFVDGQCALANGERRIICSNSAEFLPGTKLQIESGSEPVLSSLPLPTRADGFTLWWK